MAREEKVGFSHYISLLEQRRFNRVSLLFYSKRISGHLTPSIYKIKNKGPER